MIQYRELSRLLQELSRKDWFQSTIAPFRVFIVLIDPDSEPEAYALEYIAPASGLTLKPHQLSVHETKTAIYLSESTLLAALNTELNLRQYVARVFMKIMQDSKFQLPPWKQVAIWVRGIIWVLSTAQRSLRVVKKNTPIPSFSESRERINHHV